jgi:choline dehydrogenase-like flavoprotein
VAANLAEGGNLTLRTSNPFDQPLINPNILGSSFDVHAMLHALRAAHKFFTTTQAFKGYVLDLAGPWTEAVVADDEAAVRVLRETVSHAWHPVGTAAMSPLNAKWGVVDPDLRVKGVEGRRC